jgi:SAM-dependent methyltransferase
MSAHASPGQPAKVTPGKPTRERYDAASPCKICGAASPVLWVREEREPIPVYDFFGPDYVRPYYQCPECDFIFCTDFDALCAEELDWIYDGMATQSKIEGRLNRGVRELQMVARFAQLQGIDLRRAKTLVFGCGTGLSFNLMLRNEMRVWATDYARFDFVNVDYQDTIYLKSLAPLMRKKFIGLNRLPEAEFDMVAMTEVFEHLTRPIDELRNVVAAMRPGGFLIGTTGWVDRMGTDFPTWWYKGAQTHVSFLSTRSFALIAQALGCLGMLFPSTPQLIGDTDMSASQCVFVLNKL